MTYINFPPNIGSPTTTGHPTRMGWVCPKCNKSVSPDYSTCPCPNSYVQTSNNVWIANSSPTTGYPPYNPGGVYISGGSTNNVVSAGRNDTVKSGGYWDSSISLDSGGSDGD